MIEINFKLVLVACVLLLAACSGDSQVAGAPKPLTTSVPEGEIEPTPTQETMPRPSPGTAGAESTGHQDGRGVRVIVAEGSTARYLVREQLARLDAPNDAIGSTSHIEGYIQFDHNGIVQEDESRIRVDLQTLRSDKSRRDRYLRENSLESDKFPFADILVRATTGLEWPPPTDGHATFQLVGDMTIHGITAPETCDVDILFSPGEIAGKARTSFTFDTFSMKIPRLFFILSVDNEIRLELDLVLDIVKDSIVNQVQDIKPVSVENTASPTSGSETIIAPKAGAPNHPPRQSGRPKDRYSCSINASGYCIFSGKPHETGLDPGTEDIVDRNGNVLFSVNDAAVADSSGNILMPKGTPGFPGVELIKFSHAGMNDDEKAFHRVMAIMFPIRNALMYDIADIKQEQWNALVLELKDRDIKNKTFTGGPTPRDNYYSSQGIFDLAKNPRGRDIHHDVMKFLEESGLYLLCHVTSDEFGEMLSESHPENHDPCKDAEINVKIPFKIPDQ